MYYTFFFPKLNVGGFPKNIKPKARNAARKKVALSGTCGKKKNTRARAEKIKNLPIFTRISRYTMNSSASGPLAAAFS